MTPDFKWHRSVLPVFELYVKGVAQHVLLKMSFSQHYTSFCSILSCDSTAVIYSTMDEHLGNFQLAAVDSVGMSICVCVVW